MKQLARPRISVVTPSLNKGKFIGQCIQSVKVQGDLVYEHIIIDGLSDDNTHEVVMANNHERLKWISKRDESQSDALNKGFDLAQGDIICWLNADDYLSDSSLERIWPYLSMPSWDVLYGDMEVVDVDGKRIEYLHNMPYRPRYLLRMGNYIPSTGCFFRKRTTFDNGLQFRTQLRYVMDYDLFLQCSCRGLKFKNVPHLVSAFRMYEGNLTSERSARLAERRQVQHDFGLYTPNNFLGKMNMWLNFYCFRTLYKAEVYFRKQTPG